MFATRLASGTPFVQVVWTFSQSHTRFLAIGEFDACCLEGAPNRSGQMGRNRSQGALKIGERRDAQAGRVSELTLSKVYQRAASAALGGCDFSAILRQPSTPWTIFQVAMSARQVPTAAACPRPAPSFKRGIRSSHEIDSRARRSRAGDAIHLESILSDFSGLRRHSRVAAPRSRATSVSRARMRPSISRATRFAPWRGGKPGKTKGFISQSETKRFRDGVVSH